MRYASRAPGSRDAGASGEGFWASLSRTQVLALAAAFLLAADVAWHLVGGWGLVTLHVRNAPLAQVVRSISRQGRIRIETNLDPDTKVSMDVERVPATEALETLGVVTEARWRLYYLVGPDKKALLGMIHDWAAGQRDEGWRWINRNLPLNLLPGLLPSDPDAPAPDPRRDRVVLKADPALTQVQPILEQVALLADAGAVVPEAWNPSVGAFGAEKPLGSLVPKIARAGHGSSYEVFLLLKSRGRPTADGAPPEEGGGGGFFRDPDRMDAAFQARVDRLSPADKAEAQAQLDAMRDFRKTMSTLTPEQRRARMLDRMKDPAFQEAMQNRAINRESKMTPEQRDARYSHYVAGKAAAVTAATGAAPAASGGGGAAAAAPAPAH